VSVAPSRVGLTEHVAWDQEWDLKFDKSKLSHVVLENMCYWRRWVRPESLSAPSCHHAMSHHVTGGVGT
jgi:hypothetical protein